jgi:MerR family transcriptional regulator, light-induced transcriptional regulator
MDQGKYRIRIAAEMTGTTAPQLRVWEKRYGVPQPRRSDHRYRLYSDNDVRELRRMGQLVSNGLQPSQAARRVVEERKTKEVLSADLPKAHAAYAQATMMQAIRDFDGETLESQLNLLLRVGPVGQTWNEVIRPLMEEVGQAWFNGDLNPAQEHVASNGVRYTLQTMYRLIEPKRPHGTVALACVSDELHDLPLFGLAVEMATLGWRCMMLGARVPAYAVADALASKVDVVGLSITIPLETDDPTAFWKSYSDVVGSRPWLVGGRAASLYADIIEGFGGKVVSSTEQVASALNHFKQNR